VSFSVLSEFDHLVGSVHDRVDCLVSTSLWDLDRSRLNGWWAQFVTKEERFFAACLLDSLIYRSKEQFSAGLRTLYHQPVRWAAASKVPGDDDLDLVRLLRKPGPGLIRLTPVICDHDPPTKSGPLILRRAKKALGITEECMAWPWAVEQAIDREHVQVVIFVDDFLGTGNQFCEFIRTMMRGKLDTSVKWIYAPVVAHTDGLKKVNAEFPQITVVYAELLEPQHSFFNSEYWPSVSNGGISAIDALAFYESFMRKHGLKGTLKAPLKGYGELSLCFGFEHATPDNTLPILWHNRSEWTNLLQR